MKVVTVRGVRRRLGLLRRRVSNPTLQEGSLTQHLLGRYCTGRGVEVGPGRRRIGPRDRTTTFDRYSAFVGSGATDVDVMADGGDLPIGDGAVDFLISAHCLEHVPDALRHLEEWLRVLRPAGCLFLVLPHMNRTFDRGRCLSTLEHHLAERGTPNDLDRPLHWDEWERRLLRDQPAWLERPGARNADGSINPRYAAERSFIHYHCWTQNEMVRILQHLGCEILVALEFVPDRIDSFVVVAQKSGRQDDKQEPLSESALA